jgi:hypothetical protein
MGWVSVGQIMTPRVRGERYFAGGGRLWGEEVPKVSRPLIAADAGQRLPRAIMER